MTHHLFQVSYVLLLHFNKTHLALLFIKTPKERILWHPLLVLP